MAKKKKSTAPAVSRLRALLALQAMIENLVDELDAMGFDDPDDEVNGGDLVDLIGESLPTLRQHLADAKQQPGTPLARVVVGIEGGLCTGGSSDAEAIELIVLDYHTEGAEQGEILSVPQPRQTAQTTAVVSHAAAAEFNSDWVTAVAAAIQRG